MAIVLLYLSIYILLLAIFYQDLRDRAVSLILFLCLFVLVVIRFVVDSVAQVEYIFINGSIILVQVLAVLLYIQLRFKSFKVQSFLGAGDIVFWFVLVFLFSPLNFMLFYICSIFISLLLYLLYRKFYNFTKINTIPLAGFQSLLLIFALAFDQLSKGWHSYDDYVLLNFINLV